jgi:DNA-binding GntR family transcriptional regulator
MGTVESDSMSESNQLPVQAKLPSKLDGYVELDVRFHFLVAQVSGDAIAGEIIGCIVPVLCDSNRAVLCLQANMDQILDDEQAIVDRLASGDAARTEQATRAHVARVRNDVESFPKEEGPSVSQA